MSKYTQRKDGEGWEVKPGEVFKLACCDCGLVHQVVIVIEDGKAGIAAKRDARATGQRRRKHSLENVKEHAPLSAGAGADNGVDVETKEEHVNTAADRGCCDSTCSPLFIPVSRWPYTGQYFDCGCCGVPMFRTIEEDHNRLVCEWPPCPQKGAVMKVSLRHPDLMLRSGLENRGEDSPYPGQVL